MPSDRIEIGTVTTVNVAKRSLRIAPHRAQAHQLNQLEWIFVAPKGESPIRCKVDTVRVGESNAIVTLGSGISRDRVAQMVKARVSVERAAATPRPEGFFETEELIGMALHDEFGQEIGTVRTAHDTPAHAIIEVDTVDGDGFMMPVVPESILEIDFDDDVITVGDLTPFRVDHAD